MIEQLRSNFFVHLLESEESSEETSHISLLETKTSLEETSDIPRE